MDLGKYNEKGLNLLCLISGGPQVEREEVSQRLRKKVFSDLHPHHKK